jgi:uncharacterized phage-associated protein
MVRKIAMAGPYSVRTVADQFLKLAQRDHVSVDVNQLQSLIFLAHGYWLGLSMGPLVDEQFEATSNGPHLSSLNGNYVWDSEQQKVIETDHNDNSVATIALTDKEELDMIEFIWKKYSSLGDVQLRALTCVRDGAWDRVARRGEMRISNAIVEDAFGTFIDDDWLAD